MSNIYIQEPPALGKVLLKTTAGEIDIELWTKEAPKACRNFIQLCMEGYYNGTIFHRVVPGFIVQGGDPNGDGTGGESIYGAPFKDEFHSRLRFNRRGLVGSANAGKDDNGSQFFFTLAATPELQNKHTIFGKVTGETIYNVLKLSEGLIGPDDRPDHPHKITSTTVLINPFTDIVPRVQETREEERPKKKKKERQGVKNFGLLSFGEEAEEDEGEAQEYRGKPKSTHDLLEDPKLSSKTAAELELEEEQKSEKPELTEEENEEKIKETAAAVSNIRDKLSSKKRGKSPEGDSKRQRTEKKVIEEKKEMVEDSDSSVEEYYIGKEKDDARQKEKERIQKEIKELRKEMKNSKDEKIREQNAKEQSAKDDAKDKKIEEDNEMYKKYVEEQEKYRKMKEKLPKKGAARNGRQRSSRKIIRRKPWVKNLYENREYPDNHTDGKFLQELRKNLNVQKVTLPEAIQGSFRVVLRLCICVLYAIIFVYMYNDWVHTYTIIYTSIIISLFSYFLYIYFAGTDVLRHLKTVLVYVTIGYLLSPILHTLTDTVSTDTIYAWAVLMMIIHMIFFDYNVPAALVSNSLSINAAIFSSVCLVSRLSTPFNAFVLLTISVILFVLSPQLFKTILHTKLFNIIYFITLILTVICLYSVSTTLLCYFVLIVFVLSGYCPFFFVYWQKYKDNKYGPWDEAVINDSDDLEECLFVK
nr:spliceosome-associated protein CWC27 homolog isoform X1 [Helicoverpa armigera]